MRATRFPARAAGPAERLTGFIAHLRMNGVTAGPAETSDAMQALGHVAATDPAEARLALKTLLAGDADGWARFDALFDAYWFNAGRERAGTARAEHVRRQAAKPVLWQPHFDEPDGAADDGEATPDQGIGDGDAEGTDGRLIATRSA
ncbi:MAG: carbon monoxide dehydrogenase, partial [Pseudomonadota bacterium]